MKKNNVCNICGGQLVGGMCDFCWYGMRCDPDNWVAQLREKGIAVERTGGCINTSGAIICTPPYSKKKRPRIRRTDGVGR
jgi:hypothetical protein